jgi:digeranylgeranylglycerophospholipid reductase
MSTYKVVIIGGGAAGLMLARELGKKKCQTLLLERKKDLLNFSFNTLGSFINLEKFDLTENVVAQKLNQFVIKSKFFKNSIKTKAYILDKKKLHEELLNSIDTNYVNILTNTPIVDFIKDEKKGITTVIDKKGNEYFGEIFVDASGNQGVISKKLGLMEKKPALATGVEYNVEYKGKVDEAFLLLGKDYQGGYGWIFPLKNKRAIIGFGTFDEKIVKDLKSRLNQILELKSIKKLVKKDNDLVEGGSIPITPVIDQFVIDNLICVGDSVSQVNPIVGEGYKFIFESAYMASDIIEKTLQLNDITFLTEYEALWRKRFLTNYQRSKRKQKVIFGMSKNNLLIDLGILLSKLRSNKKNLKSLSGEYELKS